MFGLPPLTIWYEKYGPFLFLKIYLDSLKNIAISTKENLLTL
jgi:hypothetical protein